MTEEEACATKRRFTKRAAAKIVASAARKRFGYNLRVYRCKVCRDYHLTSITEEGRSKAAKVDAHCSVGRRIDTEEQAAKRAEYMTIKRGVEYEYYACTCSFFHLRPKYR